MTKETILLIDGNSIAFRAFFAMHNQLERFKNSDGLHTNALYAFQLMLDSSLERLRPTYVLVAFDASRTTFRTKKYKDYKAGRNKTPKEFSEQLPFIRQLLEFKGLRWYELPDYEADDILGTMAKRAVDNGNFEVIILSADRDLLQLVCSEVTVELTKKGVSEVEVNTPEVIWEKYELKPEMIIDLKGLMGDSSDNIPGVTKIGEKTALKLLHEYGSLEGIYEHVESMKPSKMRDNLVREKDVAFLSRELATIDQDAPVALSLEDTRVGEVDSEGLIGFYKDMNFQKFLAKHLQENGEVDSLTDLEEVSFRVIEEIKEDYLPKQQASLMVEMIDENYHKEDIVGIAWGDKNAIYVASIKVCLESSLFKDWLADEKILKKLFDSKAAYVALNRYGFTLSGVNFDLLIAGYLLDTNGKNSDIACIVEQYGYTNVDSDERIYGKGAKRSLPEDHVLFEHLARKILAIEYAFSVLKSALKEKEQFHLFTDMEMPLALVLAKMEIAGIRVDAQTLLTMKAEIAGKIEILEQVIYEKAGEEFNINSPKQLGVILFEKLGYPTRKKTKTGYSTAVDVLEGMRKFAPIVDDILNYRQLSKLQSTYIEGMLKEVAKDGKVHTRYVQTLTQTGRLSSVEPNLQNIPIRLEYGRMIRKAFVPSQENSVLYSSDYSQIELRVLAHISKDKHLQEAFLNGEDIHTSTAMRVFGVKKEAVDSDLRRRAKAVNFGVVYGISDYGLSQNLGIYRKEAQEFIDRYFEKYPGVKRYMEDIVQKARKQGFVETLYHRRRYLPEIHSANFNIRSFAERTAINSPIQGSAADILKVAMVKIDQRLAQSSLQAKMLLQVHDELVFEVLESQIEDLNILVKEVMEKTVKLSVPLVTDTHWGKTWFDAK
ncbi:MAG: DNA polymerase I [Lactobacillales bacterium]|nr:DNA polymerase I [Lactobacillales bacterium]